MPNNGRRVIAGVAAALDLIALILTPAPVSARALSAMVETSCGQIRLEDFPREEVEIATQAVVEACGQLHAASMKESVEGRSWETGCRMTPLGARRRASGQDVYRALVEQQAGFILIRRKVGVSATVAMTDVVAREIKIMPERFIAAAGGDRAARAALINTITHEITHLVPADGAPSTSRYTDSGYWLPWCSASRLVSYGVGGLAETVWLQAHP